MKGLRQSVVAISGALFIVSAAAVSFAADPPSRVARLKYVSGQVSMQPGGVNDWVPASINRPLTTADRVWTDQESRAELHLGSAAMRMDSETSLTLSNLSDSTVQVELDQGTLNLRVAHMFNGEIYEVDTPNTAFTILKSGSYRFDVDSQGDSTVATVWKGKVIATGDGPAVRIESRRQARFVNGKSLDHEMSGAPRFDGFDEWCHVRDDRESHVLSVRYVSPDVIGYEDLDEYGEWRVVPEYGAVWVPTAVGYDWAPYRYGHWIWVEPWGWTWVDDASWGFAPFHYGRWVFLGESWAWIPGPARLRPCYAPALVVWIGAGSGMGWFPLGYREPYIPYYRSSRSYFQTVNVTNTRITNITYVTNNYYNNNNSTNVRVNNIHYVNQRYPGAVTVVEKSTIINSEPVGQATVPMRNADWRNTRVIAGPAVSPSRTSVLGTREGERGADPSDRIAARPIVMKLAPPARPVPFEVKEQALARNPGRPLDNREEQRLRKVAENNAGRDAARIPDRRDDRIRPADSDRGPVNADRRYDPNQINMEGRPGVDASERPFPHPVYGDRGANTGTQQSQVPVNRPGNDARDHRNNNLPQPTNTTEGRGDDLSSTRRFPHPGDRGQNTGMQQSQAPVNRPGNDGRDNRQMPQTNGMGDGRNFPHPGAGDHGPNVGAQQSQAPVNRPGNDGRDNRQMPQTNGMGDGRNFPHPGAGDHGPNVGAQQSQAPVNRPGNDGRDNRQMPQTNGMGDGRNFPHPGAGDHGPNVGAQQSQAPVNRPGNDGRDNRQMPQTNGMGDGRNFPHPGAGDHGPNVGAQQSQTAAPELRGGQNNTQSTPQRGRDIQPMPSQQARTVEAPRPAPMPAESHAPARESAPRAQAPAPSHAEQKGSAKSDGHDPGPKK